MARTSSILTEPEWKSRLGELLKQIAEEQQITPNRIGQYLDRMASSSGNNRTSDWSRYSSGERIPSEQQLPLLGKALNLPLPVMRVCAGYVDDIFECAYSAISAQSAALLDPACSNTRAVFAFLFSLFPHEEMHTGNLCALWSFISGRPIGLNLVADGGFLSGDDWNATWLYSEAPQPCDVYETRLDPTMEGIVFVPTTTVCGREPWTQYSLQADMQVDLASPLASRILSMPRIGLPKSESLREAQHILHAVSLPLTVRDKLATAIVHCWADQRNKAVADAVRRDLFPHRVKTITDEAVEWVLDKRSERPQHEEFWV